MAVSNTTRERIVDEAMHLFSEHGYAATSVAKIEAAAGLTAGAGGLYHHFKSKEAVLAAGIERQLSRLDALRDIRRLLTPLGDLKAELTLIARYILAELDSEAELLRIIVSEARKRPRLLTTAVDQLVNSSFEGFASWIEERVEQPPAGASTATLATLGLGALLSNRLLRDVFGIPSAIEDEELVDAWVGLMISALGEAGSPAPPV
jgi:AcrR family transcriptional regulator